MMGCMTEAKVGWGNLSSYWRCCYGDSERDQQCSSNAADTVQTNDPASLSRKSGNRTAGMFSFTL
jgi:hypothetical protein